MKKVLFIILMGTMFGQTKLETRAYYDIPFTNGDLDFNGMFDELDYVNITFIDFDFNNNFQEQIEIKSNDVVLFMKGTPAFPMCGFSAAVAQILSEIGVKFSSVNVLENENMREGIKQFSNWPTIPQLYIKEEFIGGCDIVKEMFESGELLELFNTRGIEVKPS